jgi:hypothetical protein
VKQRKGQAQLALWREMSRNKKWKGEGVSSHVLKSGRKRLESSMGNKTLIVGATVRKMPEQRMSTVKDSCSTKDFPLEVAMLLDVLARIEARRQARLHSEGKEEVYAASEISS